MSRIAHLRWMFGFVFPTAFLVAPALADLSASAEISTSQTSAPFTYTVNLHNDGDTDIGTFWFAWLPSFTDYDLMPSVPTVTGAPAGWSFPVTNSGAGDGYGIEWYNRSGLPIAPGGSSSAFTFISNDSPATLAGDSPFLSGVPVTTSFVYIGMPETDPGYSFTVTVNVPEPASVSICMLAGGLILKRRTRR